MHNPLLNGQIQIPSFVTTHLGWSSPLSPMPMPPSKTSINRGNIPRFKVKIIQYNLEPLQSPKDLNRVCILRCKKGTIQVFCSTPHLGQIDYAPHDSTPNYELGLGGLIMSHETRLDLSHPKWLNPNLFFCYSAYWLEQPLSP